jgi:hypothetical protein
VNITTDASRSSCMKQYGALFVLSFIKKRGLLKCKWVSLEECSVMTGIQDTNAGLIIQITSHE